MQNYKKWGGSESGFTEVRELQVISNLSFFLLSYFRCLLEIIFTLVFFIIYVQLHKANIFLYNLTGNIRSFVIQLDFVSRAYKELITIFFLFLWNFLALCFRNYSASLPQLKQLI